MPSNRPTKTPTDYLIMAISPVLIIVLVHSVCFFLMDVFYRSQALTGARWVLFWFVLAVVLITRIGIEQGDTQGVVYGVLLAVATWFYLAVVQNSVFLGALLLALVWFTAHKITVSCTLVDDDADASGQGLMDSVRQFPKWLKLRAQEKSSISTPPVIAPIAPPPPSFGRGTPKVARSRPTPVAAPEKKQRKSSAQVPGAWLIYFSLAALPAFGVGQMLLPAGDLAARHRGFVYLFSYLAAALGLLVTTSFLGLRRYLRQRYVTMPGNIALGWIQFGAVGIVVVLSASLLLPRPGAGAAWTTLRYQIDYQLRQASQYAARFSPKGRGEGRTSDQASSAGQTENPSSTSGQSAGQNPAKPSDANQTNEQPNGNSGQTGASQLSPTPAAGPGFSIFKLLFYGVVLCGLAWLGYRYRVMIVTLLRDLGMAVRRLIADLMSWFHPRPIAQGAVMARAPLAPFKTFKNPFSTGENRTWPPEQLIAYTYAAVQSWALAEDSPRSPRTPREFCRQLAAEIPDATVPLEHLAFLYGHVAYGGSVPAVYHPEHLHLLWDFLALPRPKLVSADLKSSPIP